MASRGVLFAIDDLQLAELKRRSSQDARVEYVSEVIEPKLFGTDFAAQTDKAWDGIHRCFDEGDLSYETDHPRKFAILGGEPLQFEDDYLIILKTPDQVSACAGALSSVSQTELKRLYQQIDPDEYGMPLSDEDFEYIFEWFTGVRDFYNQNAGNGRSIIFTVDW